ncbi:hypothetical protein CTheo_8029 [Ceratobasidium theobromae]|uniref:Uncharacterized protein n=1 Tax=Ceratobasidium theobromae TaxID=1582974 RepID=A0A5N5QAS6_9AGAM|nr:hypothetical protein CTheo_8029 [Ceratobasidium theobromae]
MAIEGILTGLQKKVIRQFEPLDQVYTKKLLFQFLRQAYSRYTACQVPSRFTIDRNVEMENPSLLVCIVTEGTFSPGGGLWWLEQPDKRWHETLVDLYDNCFSPATAEALISKFKKRIVVQVACGVGLDIGGVQELQEWIYRTDLIDGIIAPTKEALHPGQLTGFITNLALLLFVEGSSYDAALVEAWLLDEEARKHTDMVLLGSGNQALLFKWASLGRPLGQDLPHCGCGNQFTARWRHKKMIEAPNLFTHIYKCAGCSKYLKMQIKMPSSFRQLEACGTGYIMSPWPTPDPDVIFTFSDYSK